MLSSRLWVILRSVLNNAGTLRANPLESNLYNSYLKSEFLQHKRTL